MRKLKIILCLVMLCGFAFMSEQKDINNLEEQVTQKQITIHVEGAVQTEGDYTYDKVCTVLEALATIELSQDADLANINQDKLIYHEMLLYIPPKNKNAISLNEATSEELQTIPGIGPTKAAAIIAARPFSSIEDLMQVKGIGEKSYRKYRSYVSL